MDIENKLKRESSVSSQPVFLSENYSNKPYMKSDLEFPFECDLHGFHDHLDDDHRQFHVDGSCLNPMFGVQTGSNFDSFDVFPYGFSSNMDFFECKPFAANDNDGGQGQVMDNFQSGERYLMKFCEGNNPMEIMGSASNQGHQTTLNFLEMKSDTSFMVPDEVSCVTANNHDYHKKVGTNKNMALASSARTWKSRKKNNFVKGQWTIEEDRLLIQLVEQHGLRKWSHIAQMLPGRIGKQCRERWHNHLRPDIKKDIWSEEEDKILIQAHVEIGNKWVEIAKRLPGRTENSIKNHWNATKRRQFSKRKCHSKYPRGTLLQDYIKGLNLEDSTTGRYQGKISVTAAAPAAIGVTAVKVQNQQPMKAALDLSQNGGLVPSCDFYEIPDFDFDEKMFQEGCTIESLLDEVQCDAVVGEKGFDMDDVGVEDVSPVLMDFEVKEMDFVGDETFKRQNVKP